MDTRSLSFKNGFGSESLEPCSHLNNNDDNDDDCDDGDDNAIEEGGEVESKDTINCQGQ